MALSLCAEPQTLFFFFGSCTLPLSHTRYTKDNNYFWGYDPPKILEKWIYVYSFSGDCVQVSQVKIRFNLSVELYFSKKYYSNKSPAILNYELVRASCGGVLYLYLFGMRWNLGIKGDRKGAGLKNSSWVGLENIKETEIWRILTEVTFVFMVFLPLRWTDRGRAEVERFSWY